MYETFFGLRDKPFQLTPDSEYLYLSTSHADVLTHLDYALQENQGFMAITGEIGSGKTLLVNHLLRKVELTAMVGLISNSSLAAADFLQLVCDEFEVPTEGKGPAHALAAFNRFLLDEYAAGRRVILFVDEAQSLPEDTLEEIRLLSNLQTEKHFLLHTILVGQPELRDILKRPTMEQLRQRITVQCHLTALRDEELGQYVRHRLAVAGRKEELFTTDAIDALRHHSNGIPRLVNVLAHAALVAAFAEGLPLVNAALVEKVAQARNAGGTFEVPQRDNWVDAAPDTLERLARLETRVGELESDVGRVDERLTQSLEKIRGVLLKLKELVRSLHNSPREAGKAPSTGVLGAFRKLWEK